MASRGTTNNNNSAVFFRFGIPRVLGNSFLGRLKESGLQARAGRCRGRAPKLKTKMRSESSASKKKVPSCDYRAPPPPKRNEKTFENIAEAACKHISYKSVGHRTACLADIWKSYTDRRLENASGTKRLALSRETFFVRIIDFHTLPGGNSPILQCILHFTRPTSPRTQPSLLLSDGLFAFFLHLFISPPLPSSLHRFPLVFALEFRGCSEILS